MLRVGPKCTDRVCRRLGYRFFWESMGEWESKGVNASALLPLTWLR